MELKDVLDERIIDLNMEAKNKDEAIRHLAAKLKDANYIGDVDEFVKDIYLRESEGVTGIGNFVAIPHGKSDSVTQVGIAIGKLNNEIEWETLDGQGVKLIFLFAVSNDHEYARNHMKLLAQIAGKLGNDENIEKLLNAKTVEELKEVITGIRNARAKMNVHPSKKSKLIFVTKKYANIIKESEEFLKKLGFGEEIEIRENKENIPQNAVSIVSSNLELFIPFEDLVDIKEEIERLEKEKAKVLVEKEKTDKMLSNPGFVAKAPAAKVEEEKEKQAKFNEMIKTIEERIQGLK